MIEHMSLPVRDHAKAKAFYTAALGPLGYHIQYDLEDATGYMEGGHTSFWIVAKTPGDPTHVAFRTESAAAVNAFHEEGIEAGGTDNGAPGYRSDYSPDYYAAFIHDPEGNNIEAVWYDPSKASS